MLRFRGWTGSFAAVFFKGGGGSISLIQIVFLFVCVKSLSSVRSCSARHCTYFFFSCTATLSACLPAPPLLFGCSVFAAYKPCRRPAPGMFFFTPYCFCPFGRVRWQWGFFLSPLLCPTPPLKVTSHLIPQRPFLPWPPQLISSTLQL